jgi:F-type H+-transporting ATPase subunit b
MIHHLATVLAAEDPSQSHSWILPEGYELVWGSIASVLIIALLWWKAGPIIKKSMQDRTDRIQGEIDGAAKALSDADAEAEAIRKAVGDIGAERARILADADAQAEALIADGRARLDAEIADLHAKADADIAAVRSRSGDELRAEIARLASAAADRVVQQTLDADAQQRLVEDFIARVGAGATP